MQVKEININPGTIKGYRIFKKKEYKISFLGGPTTPNYSTTSLGDSIYMHKVFFVKFSGWIILEVVLLFANISQNLCINIHSFLENWNIFIFSFAKLGQLELINICICQKLSTQIYSFLHLVPKIIFVTHSCVQYLIVGCCVQYVLVICWVQYVIIVCCVQYVIVVCSIQYVILVCCVYYASVVYCVQYVTVVCSIQYVFVVCCV